MSIGKEKKKNGSYDYGDKESVKQLCRNMEKVNVTRKVKIKFLGSPQFVLN